MMSWHEEQNVQSCTHVMSEVDAESLLLIYIYMYIHDIYLYVISLYIYICI